MQGLATVEDDIAVEEPTAMWEALAPAAQPETGPERFFTRGMLESLPRRRDDRVQVLEHLAGRLFSQPERHLSEPELMGALRELARDPVGVRRELVDRGMVDRERDGSTYWLRRASGT